MKNPTPKLLDRDVSILAFNRRVLSLAEREDFPLLERLRFLCIVSNNLDEFFEVRMLQQLQAAQDNVSKGLVTKQTFADVSAQAHALVEKQYQLFNEVLMPTLEKEGVQLVSGTVRTEEQIKWVAQYFQKEVKPLLMPVALDPSHPFPQVANKSLNFIVELASEQNGERSIAIVRVPRVVPRLIQLPDRISGKNQCFVSLTSVIRSNLQDLFAGKKIVHFSQFRVTRNSDLALDEDDVSNLRTALREELAHRQYGRAIRMEVTHECHEELADFLLTQFHLPAQALYRVNGPVNLGRLIQLPDLAEGAHLKFPPFYPQWPKTLQKNTSLFEQIQEKDVLIHQPYESFEAVVQLLEEAVNDDNVLAIRQTIYRTGSDVRILKLLQEAVRRGKDVLVVVELKARFDEETNINSAEALEAIGAQVVYGVVGLKTHAKMLLIMRRENGKLNYYGHLSTGNYNPKTAKMYTDVSMMTADRLITRDMEYLFRHIASQVQLPRMQKILAAPFHLHKQMIVHMKAATQAAKNGLPARMIVKVNALTDVALTQQLIAAGRAGVQIDLIVRGACILPVDASGLEGRIRVRSVVGRLLEHSRVFYFNINGEEKMWLSSADWMSRNMMRRVEIAWPIEDKANQARILRECCQLYLADNQDAWLLMENGNYVAARSVALADGDQKEAEKISAQRMLLQQYVGN
jgi:polyphosphate kinase